jgi:1,2-diacylglycerol 3-alpha-glucosyltransferase
VPAFDDISIDDTGGQVRLTTLDLLYVGTLPPQPGGAAVVGAGLLERLAARGHTIRALAPIVAGTSPGWPEPAGPRGAGTTWFRVPRFDSAPDEPPDTEFAELERESLTRNTLALIRDRRPDVIVIGRESFARHVPTLARAHGVPCLMLVHGDPSRGLIDGTYPEPHAGRLLAQYHEVDHIATPARHMAEGLRRIGLSRVTVIPNGVDLGAFAPRPRDDSLARDLRIPDDWVVLAHASKLEAGKRARDIVDSAERVLARHRDLVYVVIGDGPERATLEAACRRRDLAPRFRFVGWIPHRDMPRYINLADAVLMPSEAETQALVYLETQACARLLLASDIAAAREVVIHNDTGLLFRKGDIDDLTATTLHAVGDPLLRLRIGQTARARVASFDLDVMTTRYEDLLRHVAARPAVSAAPARARDRTARPEPPRRAP